MDEDACTSDRDSTLLSVSLFSESRLSMPMHDDALCHGLLSMTTCSNETLTDSRLHEYRSVRYRGRYGGNHTQKHSL